MENYELPYRKLCGLCPTCLSFVRMLNIKMFTKHKVVTKFSKILKKKITTC